MRCITSGGKTKIAIGLFQRVLVSIQLKESMLGGIGGGGGNKITTQGY